MVEYRRHMQWTLAFSAFTFRRSVYAEAGWPAYLLEIQTSCYSENRCQSVLWQRIIRVIGESFPPGGSHSRRGVIHASDTGRTIAAGPDLKATLGLVKRLEISKKPIRECVTVPGCCCCMPLPHNHLMDSSP